MCGHYFVSISPLQDVIIDMDILNELERQNNSDDENHEPKKLLYASGNEVERLTNACPGDLDLATTDQHSLMHG